MISMFTIRVDNVSESRRCRVTAVYFTYSRVDVPSFSLGISFSLSIKAIDIKLGENIVKDLINDILKFDDD